jgi:hypothetical protein
VRLSEKVWYVALLSVTVLAVAIAYFANVFLAVVFWIIAMLVLFTLRPE